MTFTIRQANPNESNTVANVFLRSWKALTPEIPVGHDDDQVRVWMQRSVMIEKRVFVATEQEEVIAMMALSEDDDGGWIDHLYVAPEHVGRGVGTTLVAHALGVLRAPVRLYTFQRNERARAFYEARGFKAARFGDGSGNEQGLPDVLYRCG